jgi:hypothetical protein
MEVWFRQAVRLHRACGLGVEIERNGLVIGFTNKSAVKKPQVEILQTFEGTFQVSGTPER